MSSWKVTRILFTLFISAVIILLTACTSSPDKLSNWAVTLPKDTAVYYCGVGSGLSVKSAKRAAKIDKTEKIQTSISSSINTSQTLSMELASNSFKAEVKAESAKINFRDSKLLTSAKVIHANADNSDAIKYKGSFERK